MEGRGGHPSASGMLALALCPGKHALEKACAMPRRESQFAELGTAIHRHIEDTLRGGISCLPAEQEALADRCINGLKLVKQQVEASFGVALPRIAVEKRLWALTPEGNRYYSGKYDVLMCDDSISTIVIADTKTGWGDTPDATHNLQLRTLAVLAASTYPMANRVVVAIIQPNTGPPTMAVYDRAALMLARGEIEGIVDAACKANPPRRPKAKACEFCTAKLFCKEAMGVLTKLATGDLSGDLATLLEECEIAEKVIDEVRAQAKAILEKQPTAIPGWHLHPGVERIHIDNALQAFQAAGHIIPSSEFMECCAVKVGELAEKFGAATGTKGKHAKKRLLSTLGAAATIKQNAPSLKRGDPPKERVK